MGNIFLTNCMEVLAIEEMCECCILPICCCACADLLQPPHL